MAMTVRRRTMVIKMRQSVRGRHFKVVPALLATLMIIPAFGGSASGTVGSDAKSPINVMVIAPLSNPSFSLPEFKPASEAFVDAINAEGGN